MPCTGHICGEAGADKPTLLPVVSKYDSNSYVQYIICDNDNKNFVYVLVYVFAMLTIYRLFV